MNSKNSDVRKAIEDAGLHQWEVAQELKMHEGTFCRLLRNELDAERKASIMDVICKLSSDGRKEQ